MTSDKQPLSHLDHGDGAATGIVMRFGGGGGCIRQSMNFHTAMTTIITRIVAIAFLVTGHFCLVRRGLELLITDQ